MSHEIELARRPVGEPRLDDYRLVDVEVPLPAPGEVLVRNLAMSLDPYMYLRMSAVPDSPAWTVGETMLGTAVGVVETSRSTAVLEGDLVAHDLGWREWSVLGAHEVRPLERFADLPVTAHLGALGLTGLTAYVGLTTAARVTPGCTVFVSAAAGAVGSLAGQLARDLGASRVVGSAGSAAKAKMVVDELGFDDAFCYRDGPVAELLGAAAPDGIDVYFDNVGGDHLAAALDAMNLYGTVAVCGAIAAYGATPLPADQPDLLHVLTKRLTLSGYTVRDSFDQMPAYVTHAAQLMRTGRLVSPTTEIRGLAGAPAGFVDMMRGATIGKTLVVLAEEDS